MTKPASGSWPTTPTTSARSRGRCVAGVAAGDGDPAGQRAAGEVRHQAVDGAQQRRLARAGAADDQAQLALGHVQVDAGQHRRGRCRRSVTPTCSNRITRPPPPASRRSTAGARGGRGAGQRRAPATAGSTATRTPSGRQQRQPAAAAVDAAGRSRAGSGARSTSTAAAATAPLRGDQPLGQRPRVGPVAAAAARRPPSAQPGRRDAAAPAASIGRPSAAGDAGVEQAVDADADAEQPGQVSAPVTGRRAPAGAPRRGRSRGSPSPRPGRPSARGRPRAPASRRRAGRAGPVRGRPRSRRAARTRPTPSTSCGAKVSATTTATPTSYSAPGTDRSSRRGLASALAAPTQASIVASCSPS